MHVQRRPYLPLSSLLGLLRELETFMKAKAHSIQKSLSETFYLLRKVSGISQGEIGKALGLHQTAISRIESGIQLLSPEELFLAAQFFDVKIDTFLDGTVNYWKIAENFKQPLPFPDHYTAYPFMRLRETLPFLRFLEQTKGTSFKDGFIKEFKLESKLLSSPDQNIGTGVHFDILVRLLDEKLVQTKHLKNITEVARRADVQGYFHSIYESMNTPLAMIQFWAINSHHYESNFNYVIDSASQKRLTLLSEPKSHLHDNDLSSRLDHQELGHLLCQYRSTFLTDLPKYIGLKPLKINESSCFFEGDKNCCYEIQVA